jgi:hypothetical protein
MMLKLNLSATLAAALTYFLNFNLGLGPFIASALVGLVAGKLFPKFAAPIYAASFVSMSSSEALPSLTLSALSGLFTGLMYLSVQKIFVGVGGKLGLVAFLAVFLSQMKPKLMERKRT